MYSHEKTGLSAVNSQVDLAFILPVIPPTTV